MATNFKFYCCLCLWRGNESDMENCKIDYMSDPNEWDEWYCCPNCGESYEDFCRSAFCIDNYDESLCKDVDFSEFQGKKCQHGLWKYNCLVCVEKLIKAEVDYNEQEFTSSAEFEELWGIVEKTN